MRIVFPNHGNILFQRSLVCASGQRSIDEDRKREGSDTVLTAPAEDPAREADPLQAAPEAAHAPAVGVKPGMYTVIGLCLLCGMLSSLDRMAMSVAIVPLSVDLGYSETMKGSVSSVFSIGYTLALLPLSMAQQATSPKLIMASGVALWSLLTLLTPMAADHGVSGLLAARLGVGAAEAVTVPTIQTFVSRWVPSTQRSRAMSLLYSAMQSGTILALLTAPRLVAAYDW
eukprot:CAMPEP_0172179296 /NCGR_PEP_ID=MMETSP1050-20130122/16538_1 /TAXON_ID=233186 /ORGANISM="Cryptomonas curvata, Strain CCAP979/52" /LENGTH=228 /DNA_ID=CAMNT_0012852161 /DNA_START=326 /DNA_END=1009 /DNA_ORIENTATION=-